jgi:hypothetical protein
MKSRYGVLGVQGSRIDLSLAIELLSYYRDMILDHVILGGRKLFKSVKNPNSDIYKMGSGIQWLLDKMKEAGGLLEQEKQK